MKITIVLAITSFLPLLAQAQPGPSQQEINSAIEMVRSIAALERRALVADNLGLSATQSSGFWPIYDQYTAEIRTVKTRLVRLITDYSDNYGSLTDPQAQQMLDDYLAIQSDLLKVRKKYVKRFGKVLDAKTLARFYQIENKLETVYNLPLVLEIPLVE
jgi:hypothetical protein